MKMKAVGYCEMSEAVSNTQHYKPDACMMKTYSSTFKKWMKL